MRKTKLFALIGSLTLGVAGLAALGSGLSHTEVEEVEAATTTVYLNPTSLWDLDGAGFAVYGYHSETYTPSSSDTNTIYLWNYWNYSNPYCYVFSPSELFGGWPGKPMNKVCSLKIGDDTRDLYSIELSSSQSGKISLKFSDNGNNGGSDIKDITAPFTCEQTGKKTGVAFPKNVETWTRMSKVSDTGVNSNFYSANVDLNDTIIFTRLNSTDAGMNWNNVWNQSFDLSGIPSGSNCYRVDSLDHGTIYSGSWHSYDSSKTNKVYVVGDFGRAPTWSIETGIEMHAKDDNEYFATIPLKANDSFRIYDDLVLDGKGWVTTTFKTSSPASVSADGDNVKANSNLQEGAYKVYYKHSGDDLGIYVSDKGIDTSDSLACYIMQSNADGQCTSKFPIAKTRFLAMDEAERNLFQSLTSSDAYLRYVKWAAFLGEKPWEAGKALNAPIIALSSSVDTSVWIIAVVSLVGLTAIGGYFFYRKRKEN